MVRKDASAEEIAATLVAQLFFPSLIFCLSAFTGLWNHEGAALALIAGLSVASYAIARLLTGRFGASLMIAIVGGLVIAGAAAAGALFAGLINFFGTF